MLNLAQTVERLSHVSQEHHWNPYEDLMWPEAFSLNDWHFSPEYLSLYGTELWETLEETQKKQLAFWEAVNFFSLNIHGEKSLMEGLAQRLYSRRHLETSPYLHHFLAEENRHMVLFGTFCTRYGQKVYPTKKLAFAREYAPGEEDFLFFTKILIFEEIVDVYNVHMSQDDRLAAIVRQINRFHHLDEARHLVFGRQLVQTLFEQYRSEWSAETLAHVRAYLAQYLVMAWKEYYNPQAYQDSGLEGPYSVMELAWQHPRAQDHRKRITQPCIRYLLETEILTEEPDL